MYMAFPLPDFMHTNRSALKTGYTDENALNYNLNRDIIKEGSFDALDMFSDGNASQNAYYNAETDEYFIGLNGYNSETNDDGYYSSASGTHRMSASSPSEDTLYSENDLAFRVGKYEYIASPDSIWPLITTKRGTIKQLRDFDTLISDYYGKAAYRVRDILLAASKENFSPEEFATLLKLRMDGTIKGYFPETATTIIYMNGEYHVDRDAPIDESGVFGFSRSGIALTNTHAVSEFEIIGYDKEKKAIVLHNLFSEESLVLKDSIESVKTLNVNLRHEKPIIGGIIDDHTAFLLNMASGKYTSIDLGDDFFAENFIFSKDGFLITMPVNDSETAFRWKRGKIGE